MSETELSVVCKNCGSEVSPYVTECPYCGTRIRKRAPKLERRGDALEPKLGRRQRRARERRTRDRPGGEHGGRPWATIAIVGASALMLLVLTAAGGNAFQTYGGVIVPTDTEAWRYLTAPFTYTDVGYWFVIALALVIFAPSLERRLGTLPAGLLLVACGALGTLAARGIESSQDTFTVIAGGNGIALGAVAAWFVLRRSDAADAVADDYDRVGVVVAAIVLLLLPVFDSSANIFAGLAGGLVGAISALAAAAIRPAR